MHLGKFHCAVNIIAIEVDKRNLVSLFDVIRSALANIQNSPGVPDYSVQLKSALDVFIEACKNSCVDTYPTEKAIYEQIGADKILGVNLSNSVVAAISGNNLSPYAAIQEVDVVYQRLGKFLKAINSIDSAFSELGVEFTKLGEDQTEIGISIPAEKIKTLKEFSSYVKQWDNNLSCFGEILSTGEADDDIKIRKISSSSWQLFLFSTPIVLFGISRCIDGVNGILQRLIKSKELVSQLVGSSFSTELVEQAESECKKLVNVETEKLAAEFVDEFYKKEDEGRKNELKVHLQQTIKFFVKSIGEGTTLELRYEPPKMPENKNLAGESIEEDDAYKKLIEDVKKANELATSLSLTTKKLATIEGADLIDGLLEKTVA